METKRKKVILDVDTGSDDAVAIISAILCEELEVLGIIASHGNQPLPYTLANTLRVVEMLGSDVPVLDVYKRQLLFRRSPLSCLV